MRAIALTGSRTFCALIFLLSLGPLIVDVVRVRRCLGEFTRTHDVIFTPCQARDGLGWSGYVDPVFGCLSLVFTPSEQVYIG